MVSCVGIYRGALAINSHGLPEWMIMLAATIGGVGREDAIWNCQYVIVVVAAVAAGAGVRLHR